MHVYISLTAEILASDLLVWLLTNLWGYIYLFIFEWYVKTDKVRSMDTQGNLISACSKFYALMKIFHISCMYLFKRRDLIDSIKINIRLLFSTLSKYLTFFSHGIPLNSKLRNVKWHPQGRIGSKTNFFSDFQSR